MRGGRFGEMFDAHAEAAVEERKKIIQEIMSEAEKRFALDFDGAEMNKDETDECRNVASEYLNDESKDNGDTPYVAASKIYSEFLSQYYPGLPERKVDGSDSPGDRLRLLGAFRDKKKED